jgi:hypothetical protein
MMANDKNTPGMGVMEMCPMATMCQGMAGKGGLGCRLMIPGFLLVLGGVLILLEPRVLVWLMAGTSILIGVVLFVFAILVRKMMARFTNAAREA